MRKIFKAFSQWFFILIISLILLEVLLRLLGYQVYKTTSFYLSSEPSFSLIADSTLGFRLNEGNFNITINHKIRFNATHQNGQRITKNRPSKPYKNRIDIHGCSFIYGFGENDSLTYPFLLQKKLEETEVRNYAVPGYGTLQALLILRKQLKNNDLPNKVILHYADFHDERNVLSAQYRQNLFLGFQNANAEIETLFQQSKIPYQTPQGQIQFQDWNEIYKHWIGRKHFAFINAFQTGIENQINKEEHFEVTRSILKEIETLCTHHHIELWIALIQNGEQSTKLKEESRGLKIVDMRLDLTDSTYTHLPHDSHPNAKAHQYYAEKMFDFVK